MDDLCKEALAVTAAKHWSEVTSLFFKDASYHSYEDPLDRFVGYINFRQEILQGEVHLFTCLVGTMIQEMYLASPPIRQACHDSVFNHAEVLEHDIQEAKALYVPDASWTPKSLALHTQAVIQWAFILAKAEGSALLAVETINHLKHYIKMLFNKDP